MWIITYGELVPESSTDRPYATGIIISSSCSELSMRIDIIFIYIISTIVKESLNTRRLF
jgi:hypothetical protein